jgi:PAS domain S-box-containing protein
LVPLTDADSARLLDLTHDAILVRSLDGVILYWNRGAEATYGWPASEAVGCIAQDLLQTVVPIPTEELLDTVLRNDRWEGRVRHTRRDGAGVTVETRWALQRDGQGDPQSILDVSTDITARTESEDVIRQHDSRVNAALRNRSLLMFTQDLDLRYTWVRNARLGFDDTTLIGASDDVLESKGSGELTTFKRDVLLSGVGGRGQFYLVHGEHAGWFDISVEPLRDEAGRVVGLTGTALDLAEIKQFEQDALDEQRRARLVLDATGVGIFDAEQSLRRLTAREREVLRLIADGKSSRESAALLGISVKTAETHRTNLMRKLELHSVSELVRFAVRSRLVEP